MKTFGLLIQLTTLIQDFSVLSIMAFRCGNEMDRAVPVIMVIPTDKAQDPFVGILNGCKAISRVSRTIFTCSEQRFRIWIVVAHAGPAVRGNDTQILLNVAEQRLPAGVILHQGDLSLDLSYRNTQYLGSLLAVSFGMG